MGTESEQDTSRTVVRTYVPAYQRDQWDEHADQLDMSRSEFVKSMVQAGRRGFDGAELPDEQGSSETGGDSRSHTPPADSSGLSMEETVIDSLSSDSYLSWDELLAAVSNDIETRLETTLQELQASDRVRYSGRHGGYTLEE